MSEKEESKKYKSPFREKTELKKEITDFINYHKATVIHSADRMSDFFEMNCYNKVVKFYQLDGYEVSIQNLQGDSYRYKCSPRGIQTNFSYFRVSKIVDGNEYVFDIHHNLSVQSAHHEKIYATPDITVIKANQVQQTKAHYETKLTFCFAENKDVRTFFEAKHFTPFPELLFNFIGLVNEIGPGLMSGLISSSPPFHLAPSLMVSGMTNRHTLSIKASLEERYMVNIICDLFYFGGSYFTKARFKELCRVGMKSKIPSLTDDDLWLS